MVFSKPIRKLLILFPLVYSLAKDGQVTI